MSNTTDLLGAWREATRAAELAERLAKMAADAADQADRNASASAEIAALAESAAQAAERAAHTARTAATDALAFANETRGHRLLDADQSVNDMRSIESDAREAFHEAEDDARRRHSDSQNGASTVEASSRS